MITLEQLKDRASNLSSGRLIIANDYSHKKTIEITMLEKGSENPSKIVVLPEEDVFFLFIPTDTTDVFLQELKGLSTCVCGTAVESFNLVSRKKEDPKYCGFAFFNKNTRSFIDVSTIDSNIPSGRLSNYKVQAAPKRTIDLNEEILGILPECFTEEDVYFEFVNIQNEIASLNKNEDVQTDRIAALKRRLGNLTKITRLYGVNDISETQTEICSIGINLWLEASREKYDPKAPAIIDEDTKRCYDVLNSVNDFFVPVGSSNAPYHMLVKR